MRSIYVLTQSHCQRGATAAQEKEKIKQAVTGARVHPEAACLSPLDSSASRRNGKLCHGERHQLLQKKKKKNVFATCRVAGESRPPGAAVFFLFFTAGVGNGWGRCHFLLAPLLAFSWLSGQRMSYFAAKAGMDWIAQQHRCRESFCP